MMLESANPEGKAWVDRLLELGFAVQRQLLGLVVDDMDHLVQPVAMESGDTIYKLDRYAEPVIRTVIESWSQQYKPLVLIAEGMGDHGRMFFKCGSKTTRYRLIVDPIDGTRGLMYDKRSAWFLAAVAQDRGEETSLTDTFASVIIELPTSKLCWADAIFATTGNPTTGFRQHLDNGERRPLAIQPSRAQTLKDGFAQVSNFFPGTKVLAAELMERIVLATLGGLQPGSAIVFDDQYLSTGGQMVELMLGHDRFCCDLRPLFYDIIQRQTGQTVRGLECHPYDFAGLLAAQQAGVIVTDGFGRPVDCPLDVHTGIHWCGYGNSTIQKQVEPVVLDWLEAKGVHPH